MSRIMTKQSPLRWIVPTGVVVVIGSVEQLRIAGAGGMYS